MTKYGKYFVRYYVCPECNKTTDNGVSIDSLYGGFTQIDTAVMTRLCNGCAALVGGNDFKFLKPLHSPAALWDRKTGELIEEFPDLLSLLINSTKADDEDKVS